MNVPAPIWYLMVMSMVSFHEMNDVSYEVAYLMFGLSTTSLHGLPASCPFGVSVLQAWLFRRLNQQEHH
jgi:hypothetical protein